MNSSTTNPVAASRGCPKQTLETCSFTLEGDPLHPNGLEYLFGVCSWKKGKLEFKPFWAHDHDQERTTFAEFMAFLDGHLSMHPKAYVYHYNHYETTALKRLACRYAIAEHQLDDLLRRMKFVDLYKVVRESIRISEPGYSIKNLEVFYMAIRDGEVTTAGDSIVVYNQWRETGEPKLLQQIADYNEIDCISTAKLCDGCSRIVHQRRNGLMDHHPHPIPTPRPNGLHAKGAGKTLRRRPEATVGLRHGTRSIP